jgi:inorganic pyrophosphatase
LNKDFKLFKIKEIIMDISKITTGKNPPHEVNVIIEVPLRSDPIKYEFDKESSAIIVDRFIGTSMVYPCNYGFIPHTLSGDGDPADVLVVCELPIMPGAVIAVRPIAVLMMEDESGVDEKILAVPTSKLTTYYDNINSYKDLPDILIQKISNFFENYKKLEKNKWVKLLGWEEKEKALAIIEQAIENAKKANN